MRTRKEIEDRLVATNRKLKQLRHEFSCSDDDLDIIEEIEIFETIVEELEWVLNA